MGSITLYTTHCPRCEVLKAKLIKKGITWFNEIDSIEIMTSLGIQSAPMLQIDKDELMDFSQAIKWINSWEEE